LPFSTSGEKGNAVLAWASPAGPRHAQPDWIGDGLSSKQMMHLLFLQDCLSEGVGIKMAELATGSLMVRRGSCGRYFTGCGPGLRLRQGGGHEIAESRPLANTLWSYAKMGRKPGERALGALEARVEEAARECDSQDVANTLWEIATMGRKPGTRALGALEARVKEVARECNSQEVASVLWAYATMGVKLGERVRVR
jgi:hypothetical protein